MIDLYFMEIDKENLPVEYSKLLSLVSKEKQERIERFQFHMDKKLSLYADILVRFLACQALSLPNQGLLFSTNAYGKPFLLRYPSFQYNLSHTRNAIVVGISEKEVGVDVEKIGVSMLDLARRFFAAAETEYIQSGRDEDRRFYEIWTKKEAYIKWIGTGLSLPLQAFSVLDNDAKITSFEIGDYVISICGEEVEIPQTIIPITETWLITKALEMKQ